MTSSALVNDFCEGGARHAEKRRGMDPLGCLVLVLVIVIEPVLKRDVRGSEAPLSGLDESGRTPPDESSPENFDRLEGCQCWRYVVVKLKEMVGVVQDERFEFRGAAERAWELTRYVGGEETPADEPESPHEMPPASLVCRHEAQEGLYAFLRSLGVDIDIPEVIQEVLRTVSVEQLACAHEGEDSLAG